MPKSKVERTLVILKPDAVQRGLVGEIITRFEKIGLKIVAAKMLVPSEELLNEHYPVSRKEFISGMGEKTLDNYRDLDIDPVEIFGHADPFKVGLEIQKWTVEFMKSGPVFSLVLEGPHAVELVRKVRGFTLPSKSQPGTITGDYSFDSSSLANEGKRPIRNLAHASGTVEEANFEIGLWFNDTEIHDYETIHQRLMTS